MRALVYERYRGPMTVRRLPVPEPTEGAVRVRVRAASLNSWDWDFYSGAPLIRAWGPLRPGYRVLGCDVAGVVDAVGSRVVDLRPGDAVFGDISGASWGGFAEYVCAPESCFARKPDALTFEQAAALPQAGVLALQGLRAFGAPRADFRLLLLGAGGGVGTLAVQLATADGTRVDVVDAGSKLGRLRELGASRGFDYRNEDFVAEGPRYDGVLDIVGRRSPAACLRALRPGGRYVMMGGTVVNLLALLPTMAVARLRGRRAQILAHAPNRTDLGVLAAQCVQKRLQPVIDRCCRLSEVPDALHALGRGDVFGKVVVQLADE